MAASNILSLPFRRTHPVGLSSAIKQYISSKYDQHPDMFARDLETIDKLRTDAINVLEPHQSGIRKLSAYAAQLVWIGGKFPVDIGAEFTWYPALGYNTETPTSQNNLRFELANILYNLASLYTQLAVAINRSTTEGIRSACNYFSQAAGVISCLKKNILPDMRSTPPEDMDTMTLESLEQLLLAQSQECFWQKAVMAGLKDLSIAKLAAKVSDYYSAAGDYGVKSNSITSDWLHHMTAKHHHFASAAQYRAACDALEKRKYGEEVARLRDSLACVDEALKEARYLNKVVLSDLHGLKSRVQEDLKRAEKDNDMIYLIPVPPKSELKPLDRVNMATVKIPENISNPKFLMGEHGDFGRPLFAKLVPFAVHVAASIYDERRDRLVSQTIIEVMEKMTSGIHGLLQSLNLPAALEAIEKPLGLPHNLVSHAEEVRQHDGLNRIRRSMEEISQLKDSDREIYMESVVLLIEAEEDGAARSKYGTDRWSRPSSTEAAKKLHAQADEIDGYLRSAETTDELVKTKVREHEEVIRLLGGSDRELSGYVPCSQRTALSSGVQLEASRLRSTLNECSRQESRRRRKAEALREKAKLDDITTDILAEAARLERDYPLQKIEPDNFEDLFRKRLQRYDADRKILNEEQAEQEKLEQKIKDTNRAFLNARRGDGSTKEREQALQRLEKGYHKYKEILNHLDVGHKFYNDLAKIVGKFRDECREWAWKRRAEAVQIESDHLNGMNALNLTRASDLQQQSHSQVDAALRPEKITPQGHTRHQPPTFQNHTSQENPTLQYHRPSANPPISSPQASDQLPPRPSLQAHMSRQPKASAPVPGMWTPELGIKFGAAMPPSAPPNSTVPQLQQASGESRDKPQPSVRGQWNPSHGLNFR